MAVGLGCMFFLGFLVIWNLAVGAGLSDTAVPVFALVLVYEILAGS